MFFSPLQADTVNGKDDLFKPLGRMVAGHVPLSQAMALTAGAMRSRAEVRVKKTVENFMLMIMIGVEKCVCVDELQVMMMSRGEEQGVVI